MLSITEAKLYEAFAQLKKNGEAVYLPVDNTSGEADFAEWKEGTAISKQLKTVRSAKDFFFPQTENLMKFKVHGKKINVIDTREELSDFVIFGARACDVASFKLLDRAFIEEKPVDTYYENRREHGIVVSIACSKPAASCFCTVYDIDPTHPNADVDGYRVDDTFYLEAKTAKGEKLLKQIEPMMSESDDQCVKDQIATTEKILKNLPFANLDMSRFNGDNMMDIFNDPKWNSISETCLGCGACTFVCPTCQCYDIKELDTGDGIERFRCWDSCMYKDYTQMAAANPRPSQKERFRQRFMHKLVYYPKNYNVYGCVGCGRCVDKCPTHLHIVNVIKTLGEEGK
jgi:ferredoxin